MPFDDDDPLNECNIPEKETLNYRNYRTTYQRVSNLPDITINVDMSDWSDEKMRTFFKYAYGQFEGEQ
ncbi:hypothetical protein SDC9_95114 [bioreactor metagenome]|uniref:Uncharacterized protein n=1 Tax=bioreactor metagenome TaxID=1076179 RepID=A0A645A5C4_9ZZZZ|nr:hypothetical protein [Candidatus Pelethousia sp.]